MAIFGFIGTGSMGSALARAARRTLPPEQIFLSNRTASKAEALAAELGCRAVVNQTIGERADYIFLGVKPQMMESLLSDLAPALARRHSRVILVSMAAGLTIHQIQKMAGGEYLTIRIMPNLPVGIGEGMTLYTLGKGLAHVEVKTFPEGMAGAGCFSEVPESLIDAGTAVSACGPAFVALFIDALVDGAVVCGVPRAKALEEAAQMVIGTAKLIQNGTYSPAALKDAVCSPGGTTIQGIRVLEEKGMRGTVMDAIIAAYEKSSQIAAIQ